MRPATVRRCDAQHADAGVAGLVAERKGPKRKSKFTGDTVAAIRRLQAERPTEQLPPPPGCPGLPTWLTNCCAAIGGIRCCSTGSGRYPGKRFEQTAAAGRSPCADPHNRAISPIATSPSGLLTAPQPAGDHDLWAQGEGPATKSAVQLHVDCRVGMVGQGPQRRRAVGA